MICVCDEEEKDMAVNTVVDKEVEVDVKRSLVDSLKEVKDIRNGQLSKRSYKEMIGRVRESLKEDK